MHELMMIMASALPEEMIIEQIEQALNEYKLNPTKDNRGKLGMYCMLFTSKETIDTVPGGIDTVLGKMDKAKKGFDMLNRLDPNFKG